MAIFSKLIWTGGGVVIAGTLPILAYIVFGPADGNPIGLGLLAWLCWVLGGALLLIGMIGSAFRNKK